MLRASGAGSSLHDAFADIDATAVVVAARLEGLAVALPAARALATSFTADLSRHRTERRGVRATVGLPDAEAADLSQVEDPSDLGVLRDDLEALTFAHAELLPLLNSAAAVRALAGHMVDLSRQLTVIELWIEKGAPLE